MKTLWLCLAIAPLAFGQGGPTQLSPEQAVARALEMHPRIAAAQARVQAAEGSRQQAGLRPNPRLYLQSENTRLGNSAAPFRFTQDTDNFLYGSQVLEARGKRDSRLGLAAEVIQTRQLERETERLAITRSVLTTYWAALGAEQIADVLRNNLSNLEQTVDYHRIRVREGALAEVDLIRVELEKEQVAVQFQTADQDRKRLRIQLFREMGELPPNHDVVLTGDLRTVSPLATPSLEEAIAKRPDLQLAQQFVEQSAAVTRVERANAKPDSEVLLGYKRTVGLNTLIAGFQIQLPFRNRNQGAIASSLAEQRAAEYEREAANRAARSDILAAQSDFNQKLELLTRTLPRIRAQAEDTVRIARAVYREGAGDLLRLLDAERVNLQAELLYVRTLIDYRTTLVTLQTATGLLP